VFAVLASGREVAMRISPTITQFGLRFAAAILPEHDPLTGVRTLLEDGTEWSTANRVSLPEKIVGSGHGWRPGGATAS
jgi:hypothetical protein